MIAELQVLFEPLVHFRVAAEDVQAEQDHAGDRQEQQTHQGGGEPHLTEGRRFVGCFEGHEVQRTSPRCRRYDSTSLSNGTWLLVNKYMTPRRVQNSCMAAR